MSKKTPINISDWVTTNESMFYESKKLCGSFQVGHYSLKI